LWRPAAVLPSRELQQDDQSSSGIDLHLPATLEAGDQAVAAGMMVGGGRVIVDGTRAMPDGMARTVDAT